MFRFRPRESCYFFVIKMVALARKTAADKLCESASFSRVSVGFEGGNLWEVQMLVGSYASGGRVTKMLDESPEKIMLSRKSKWPHLRVEQEGYC